MAGVSRDSESVAVAVRSRSGSRGLLERKRGAGREQVRVEIRGQDSQGRSTRNAEAARRHRSSYGRTGRIRRGDDVKFGSCPHLEAKVTGGRARRLRLDAALWHETGLKPHRQVHVQAQP